MEVVYIAYENIRDDFLHTLGVSRPGRRRERDEAGRTRPAPLMNSFHHFQKFIRTVNAVIKQTTPWTTGQIVLMVFSLGLVFWSLQAKYTKQEQKLNEFLAEHETLRAVGWEGSWKVGSKYEATELRLTKKE